MAKVLQYLEKMGLVRVEVESGQAPQRQLPPEDSESAPEASPAPVVITVSKRRFAEALDEGSSAAPEDYPFDQIYEKAGVEDPPHGFTVHRLIDMMEAEELQLLEPAARARAISGMLKRLPAGPIAVQDIVQDAARRDQALDAFEAFLSARVERTVGEVEEQNRALQEEIDRITRANQEAMAENRTRIDAEKERLERWQRRKEREERRLFAAVEPFAAANPVTVEGPGEADDSR